MDKLILVFNNKIIENMINNMLQVYSYEVLIIDYKDSYTLEFFHKLPKDAFLLTDITSIDFLKNIGFYFINIIVITPIGFKIKDIYLMNPNIKFLEQPFTAIKLISLFRLS